MKCKNPQCNSSHGRLRFLGYCANCAEGLRRAFIHWFGK